MDIYERQHGEVMVLRPQVSRLEASNAPSLKNALIDQIFHGRYLLALDMSHVDFMDSSGLAALLSALKSLGPQGHLALFGVSSKVRKLFAITRMDHGVFRIADTEDEAVDSLQSASGGL